MDVADKPDFPIYEFEMSSAQTRLMNDFFHLLDASNEKHYYKYSDNQYQMVKAPIKIYELVFCCLDEKSS